METKQIYYEDPYKTEMETEIVRIDQGSGQLVNIVLKETIFYPEGGGQPNDHGEIIGPNGQAKVEYVRVIQGEIIHQATIVGELSPGEKVLCKLNWNWRLKYMKIHSAGHLLHDVLLSMANGLIPLKGGHASKAFLEYKGEISPDLKAELEEKVNNIALNDLLIVSKDVSYEDLVSLCKFVPPNLPKNKKLRMIKVGDYDGMPDGGVHVKSTKEIGKIIINEVISQNGLTTIKYRVI